MAKLSVDGLVCGWENTVLPNFDVNKVAEKTKAAPKWVHFGAGNIFRGFIARLQHNLISAGKAESGIVAVENYDFEIIDRIYTPHDNLTLLVLMKADSTLEKHIIAGVGEALKADPLNTAQWSRLANIFENPGLQMVSFTITEKGYVLRDISGRLLPAAVNDIENGPAQPKHVIAAVTALLLTRYNKNAQPIALVSMDNCSHNGDKLREAVLEIANGWLANNFVSQGFVDWLSKTSNVSFPWSMIDKITPRPADFIANTLEHDGIENMRPIITSKNTYIAPFVNAEAPQYLVIEDTFPNGRPPLEHAGVYMTNQDTVDKTERMKVTTCLNPLHTALAIYGCVLNVDTIANALKIPMLKTLAEKIGYDEGMPVVTDPGILSPHTFIDEVMQERLPNPYMPDTPQRIATDTSQKIAIRFGETIKAYHDSNTLDPKNLTYIPLVIAGWLRYLLAVDDNGEKMEISPDPMLPVLAKALEGIELGNPEDCKQKLNTILKNELLFGVNLYSVGLGEKIESMFLELSAGKGAVMATLEKYCK